MKPEIRERYKDVAKYDDWMPKIFPGYEPWLQVADSYLSASLGDEARALDVGCGTGVWIMAFGEHHRDWKLVGVDPTEPMLGYAQAKVDDKSFGNRVTLDKGTLDDLDPESTGFDAVSMTLVEHILPDDGTKQKLIASAAQDQFIHKATKEDSIVPEERLQALFTEAGFVQATPIFRAQFFVGWLMHKPS